MFDPPFPNVKLIDNAEAHLGVFGAMDYLLVDLRYGNTASEDIVNLVREGLCNIPFTSIYQL